MCGKESECDMAETVDNFRGALNAKVVTGL